MIMCPQYRTGFYAPQRGGVPKYPALWDGCVGAWAPCLGPTGSVLRDWSGSANHGTLTNMDAGTDWFASGGRYALDFDGSNDYVSVPSVPNDIRVSNTPISVSGWISIRTLGADSHAFKVGTATVNNAFAVYMLGVGTPNRLAIGLHGTPSSEAYTPSDLATNRWYHIVGILQQSRRELFLDGTSVAVSAGAISYTIGPGFMNFAAAQISYGAYWPGMLDDWRIYNRVLNSQDIKRLSSRRCIAYELAPRSRASSAVQFNRRRRFLIGAH